MELYLHFPIYLHSADRDNLTFIIIIIVIITIIIIISGSLWTGRSGDRIPVGAMYSKPVQTGSGAHPTTCKIGTGSFCRG